MDRNHVELIQQLEEVRGGNGGDINKLGSFLNFTEGMTNQELAVLNAYADSLRLFTKELMEQRGITRVN